MWTQFENGRELSIWGSDCEHVLGESVNAAMEAEDSQERVRVVYPLRFSRGSHVQELFS